MFQNPQKSIILYLIYNVVVTFRRRHRRALRVKVGGGGRNLTTVMRCSRIELRASEPLYTPSWIFLTISIILSTSFHICKSFSRTTVLNITVLSLAMQCCKSTPTLYMNNRRKNILPLSVGIHYIYKVVQIIPKLWTLIDPKVLLLWVCFTLYQNKFS